MKKFEFVWNAILSIGYVLLQFLLISVALLILPLLIEIIIKEIIACQSNWWKCFTKNPFSFLAVTATLTTAVKIPEIVKSVAAARNMPEWETFLIGQGNNKRYYYIGNASKIQEFQTGWKIELDADWDNTSSWKKKIDEIISSNGIQVIPASIPDFTGRGARNNRKHFFVFSIPPVSEAQAFIKSGDDKMTEKDYAGAAEDYTKARDMLPISHSLHGDAEERRLVALEKWLKA